MTSAFQTGVLPHQPRTGEGTDAQAPAGRCSLNHLGLFGKLKRQLNHVQSCLGLFVTCCHLVASTCECFTICRLSTSFSRPRSTTKQLDLKHTVCGLVRVHGKDGQGSSYYETIEKACLECMQKKIYIYIYMCVCVCVCVSCETRNCQLDA